MLSTDCAMTCAQLRHLAWRAVALGGAGIEQQPRIAPGSRLGLDCAASRARRLFHLAMTRGDLIRASITPCPRMRKMTGYLLRKPSTASRRVWSGYVPSESWPFVGAALI